MKLGVIGRADPRGLGVQTSEVARNLRPERVLLIEPQPAGWAQHPQWYDGLAVTHAPWRRGVLPESTVRRWLDGLDVIYTAETAYDDRLPDWAAQAGVRVVRHANPEQLGSDEIDRAGDTAWWSATPWRLDKMPRGTRVVPMPVALDRPYPSPGSVGGGPIRFLHSIGHAAQEDRAGSLIVSRAIQRVRQRCELVVRCQDRRPEVAFRLGGKVAVTIHARGVENYWEQYAGCDVLILPRRYGGLSLPSQEAMAGGLALVMTDCSPNEVWPGPRVPVASRRAVDMRCGPVELCDADPAALADVMTDLASDRDFVTALQAEARAWAQAHSWEALSPLWRAEFARASSSRGRAAASTGSGHGAS